MAEYAIRYVTAEEHHDEHTGSSKCEASQTVAGRRREQKADKENLHLASACMRSQMVLTNRNTAPSGTGA